MVKQNHNITEDLKHLAQSTSNLVLDPANARKHNKRNVEAIAASLSKFGQRKPIVVQKDGMVVRAGNGTLDAAKSLGWTHIAAVVLDDDNTTATAFAIADNRTAELAEWDAESLASLLGQLDTNILPSTGFTDAEIEAVTEWGVDGVDIGAVGDHNEDGHHGVVKIEKVLLDERDRVVEVVENALREHGHDYKVIGC